MNLSGDAREISADACKSGSSGIGTVGAWLKEARERKGETLDDISKITRIGKNYLEAIEEGSTAKLPSQAYTRGFIRLYSAHLGLSAEEALSMLERKPAEPVEGSAATLSQQQHERKFFSPYHRNLTLAIVLILTFISGYLLFKSTNSNKTGEQKRPINAVPQYAPEKTPDKKQEQTAPQKDLPPATVPQLKNSEPPLSEGIILRLRAVSDGKVHITIDGSVSQDYDLFAGDLVEWKAETTFILDLEDAASVEGELDGVRLKPFGEPGKAAHLVLKANGPHKD